jgi:hypothetical protein
MSASGIGRIGIKALNVRQADKLLNHSGHPILNVAGGVTITTTECHSNNRSNNGNGSRQTSGMARVITTTMEVPMEVAMARMEAAKASKHSQGSPVCKQQSWLYNVVFISILDPITAGAQIDPNP